jgi:dienelactone hydrolase
MGPSDHNRTREAPLGPVVRLLLMLGDMVSTRTNRPSFDLPADGGEPVPAILQLPRATAAVPGVLLLHAFNSRKERMADSIGSALADRGIASLAIDLPMHGGRKGSTQGLSLRNPLALVQTWKLAVREAHRAIDYLATHPGIDPTRLGIAGYSIGAYLATIVAASDPRIRAVALVAGGDLPEHLPFASLVRGIVDPRRAARALAGRPLLMFNGTRDRTVTPEQAKALFAAAGEPKELRWYDGGHWLPDVAVTGIAEWLGDQLSVARTPRSTARIATSDAR